MNIGEKIKHARLNAGLTQAELAGDHITRNMISRIENGAACPSIGTIEYLAKRLNIPAAFFLSEENDRVGFYFRKGKAMDEIRKKLAEQDYDACLALCADFAGQEDDELHLVIAQCFYEIARREFKAGRMDKTRNAMETALTHCRLTVYDTTCLEFLGRFCLSLTDALERYQKSEDFQTAVPVQNPTISSDEWFCEFIFGFLSTLDSNFIPASEAVLSSGLITDESYALYIRACCAMKSGESKKASAMLHAALEYHGGCVIRARIYSELEKISYADKDFESAYRYAKMRRDLL